ncbi:5-formyltetrahydrofolate cyclo-ligase [Pasteurellaceae bacterium RH1A]|nr:5-formyltetrahydrofolate cyclo-ligase [Pasteurellaceae bacterium RH1A]
MSIQDQRQALRKQMQAARLKLSPIEQKQAEQNIIEPALELIHQYQAQNIAFYLPFKGEISPLALMKRLQAAGKSLYLPVLHPFSPGNLLFLHYHDESQLELNRFGIQEPKLDVRQVLPLCKLDLIFTPLVACDKAGNRMGMGGGFYDRTLAQAPHLISVGLAHTCQQVESLPIESWDMPLKHIILG